MLIMEFIEIDCPICDDGKKHKAEVLKIKRSKYTRRMTEFDMTVMLVRCLDCGTKGVIRKIESLGMENYEFPYEGDI